MRSRSIGRARPTVILAALVVVLAACGDLSASVRNTAAPEAALAVESGQQQQQQGESTVTPPRSFAGTQPAPEFPPVEWLNTDRPLSIADLRGKVVLLNFWTYGCINCMHIIPNLKQLEARYADELVVVGVHSAKFDHEGETGNIRQIILRYDLEHQVINDRDFLVWRAYGARTWPTLMLIDPAGNVVAGHSVTGVTFPKAASFREGLSSVIDGLVAEFDARGQMDRTPLRLKLEREGVPETLLSFPGKVLADVAGRRLFVADSNHHRVLVAHLDTYEIQQVVGGPGSGFADGDFASARFYRPQGMALSADGRTLYVADTENHAIRAVDLAGQVVETVAGTGQQTQHYPGSEGPGTEVALNSPWDLELLGDQLYVAMAGSRQLWRMDLSTGIIGPWAGSGQEGIDDGWLERASLAEPSGLATDGEHIYFADSEASAIRVVSAEDDRLGAVETIVGTGLFDFGDVDGVGNQVRLQHPLGVVYNPADGLLYVADTYNGKIKAVDPEDRRVETFAGGEGHGWRDGLAPLFYEPGGLDLAGSKLYVADTNNHAIRVVNLDTRETTTVAFRDASGVLAAAGDYGGETVRLDARRVGAGSGLVRLNVVFPDGYKVNDLAPSSIAWRTNGLIAFGDAGTRRRIPGPQFPLEFPAIFRAGGQGMVSVDLTLYYCDENKDVFCLIHEVRLEVPLEVVDETDAVLELRYTLPQPVL